MPKRLHELRVAPGDREGTVVAAEAVTNEDEAALSANTEQTSIHSNKRRQPGETR